MTHLDRHNHSPGNRPGLFRVPTQLRHLTISHLWRLIMATLMVSLFAIGMWSGLITPAYAAALNRSRTSSATDQISSRSALATHDAPRLQQSPVKQHATLLVNSSTPLDGFGDLPFYTYISYPLDDHLEMKVNVANGHMFVHMNYLHIKGTGIDESIDGYYNSQAGTTTSDLGNDWNFNLGHDVRLDLSNPSSGITLHGPSGYSAFFAFNSSTGTYTDASGLNATLVKNADGTYTLTFHRSGEKLNFGTNSHLVSDKDQNGNSLSYSYNSTHDLLSLTDSQGRVTTFTHNSAYGSGSDPSGQITGLTDPAGRTVQYHYGERGNLASTLTSVIDVQGNTTSFDYSGSDLTKITDPAGNVTTISYLNGDKIASITDATGAQMTFTYNSSTPPNTVFTDRNGHNTTYFIDTTQPTNPFSIHKVTDALGHSKTSKYDANFNQTQYGDALSNFSNFVFSSDGRNNLNSVADGNNATTSFTYASSGSNLFYPLTQKDPQGNVTSYAYDSNGNLTSAINTGTNKGLTYTYNSNGTIATMTDADGNVTTYSYDAHGNLVKVTPPNTNGSTLKPYTLTVDPKTSRVNSVTDGNNHQTTYTYDTFDRIIKISYASDGVITYAYDANGNLLSVVDNTGTTSFTYDALNRLRTKTLPGGTIIRTDYDKTGNLTSINDGSGLVTYGYDAANRMTTLTTSDGQQSVYTYDNADRKVMIQYPNLTGMKMTYDKAGHELTTIGGTMDSSGNILTTYDSFTYSYKVGTTPTALLQTVTVNVDPYNQSTHTAWAYSYDSHNWLTNANKTDSGNPLRNYTYTYDAAGNRTKDLLQRPGQSDVTNTYSYAGGNELQSKQLTGGATTTYSYDGNGNLTGSTGGPSFTYNTKNQTTNIGSDAYTYSGADQQDRVQVNTDTFVYTGLGLSARTDASGTTYFRRCSCGLLNHERTPDGKKYYYLFDGLGSIVGMTDSAGNDVNRYVYDPYGNIISQQEQSGLNNPWKFAAGYLDSSTGLYKFGTRYYDPTLGRWTQQDPVGGSLGDLNSANRYVYAGDDPVNAVDPSGKSEPPATHCFLYITGTVLVTLAGLAAVIVGLIFAPAGCGTVAHIVMYRSTS